jgi:hypothetical protein
MAAARGFSGHFTLVAGKEAVFTDVFGRVVLANTA